MTVLKKLSRYYFQSTFISPLNRTKSQGFWQFIIRLTDAKIRYSSNFLHPIRTLEHHKNKCNLILLIEDTPLKHSANVKVSEVFDKTKKMNQLQCFPLSSEEPSDNAIKYLPRTKCARGKTDALEGGEKNSSLKVKDRDKIIIKIQLSETNFRTTTEQEGQQHNCLCRAGRNWRTVRFFIVLSSQGEQTALSPSHFYQMAPPALSFAFSLCLSELSFLTSL